MIGRRKTLGGKTVVVTGAGSGIGRALARRAAAAGAAIALLDVDADTAHAVAEGLRAEGARAEAFACDVTSEAACREAIAAAAARFGAIDVLINNAGITQLGRLADVDIDGARRVMDVNFFGALYCTKAALAHLCERRGTIVVVSSVAGFAPLFGRSAYAASKHALHGLFETLRCELEYDGADVDVVMVCPGFTDTAIEAHALGGGGRKTVGRQASADDVAASIVDAVEKRRRMVVLTPVGKISRLVSRLSPRLYERLMTRRMA